MLLFGVPEQSVVLIKILFPYKGESAQRNIGLLLEEQKNISQTESEWSST